MTRPSGHSLLLSSAGTALVSAALLLAGCGKTSPGSETASPATGPRSSGGFSADDPPEPTISLLRAVGPYEVREVGPVGGGHGRLEVWRGDERVWTAVGHFVGVGQAAAVGGFISGDAPPADTAAVRDLNGDGVPDLITWRHMPGGDGSSTIVEVLELGAHGVRPLLALNVGGSGEVSGFRDLDGDGVDEFLTLDETFSDGSAEAPYPAVVLAWDPAAGTWMPSPDHMRRPTPPPAELDRRAAAIRERPGSDLAVRRLLESEMLDLIYAGYWEAADQFLASAWPGGNRPEADAPSEEAFRMELYDRMAQSPYYETVLALNGRSSLRD